MFGLLIDCSNQKNIQNFGLTAKTKNPRGRAAITESGVSFWRKEL